MAISGSQSLEFRSTTVNGDGGSSLPPTPPGRTRCSHSGFAMTKGNGADSYSRNSTAQNAVTDNSILPHLNEALKLVSLPSSGAIRIADLGCSSGPNSVRYMGRIVDKLRERFSDSISESPTPEFQVYFSDLPSNDFNNLFQLLGSEEVNKFFSAGVPGSFYGRLFPPSTIHLFFSVYCLHYMSKIPDALFDKTSPAFNKGTWWLGYDCNPATTAAIKEQASLDLKNFLHARAVELAPGGLLCFAGGMRSDDNRYCDIDDTDPIHQGMFAMKEALRELARKGIITEEEIDCANFSLFERSMEDVRRDVESFSSAYKVETLEALEIQPFKHFPLDIPTQGKELLRSICGAFKAVTGEFVKSRLGEERAEFFWECCEPIVERRLLSRRQLLGSAQMFFVALTRSATIIE